jgi:hypothetical protein
MTPDDEARFIALWAFRAAKVTEAGYETVGGCKKGR